MKKILVFAFWFGKLPNYFDFWKESVRLNPSLDFVFFTDTKKIDNIPDNLKIEYMTFEQMKSNIKGKLNFPISLETPYKVCEYRCGFGYIFPQYTEGYDFWGHCDIDVIFGDLRKFLTEDVLNSYERINTHAHLILYKNNEKLNNLFLTDHKYSCYSYKDAYKLKEVCFYDEWGGLSAFAPKFGIKQYDEIVYADIDPYNFQFNLIGLNLETEHSIFVWKDGKLFYVYLEHNQIKRIELEYAHLQKRKMIVNNVDFSAGYCIIPNEFIENVELDVEKLIELTKNKNSEYNRKLRIQKFKGKLKLGRLKQKIVLIYKNLMFDNECIAFKKERGE